MHRSHVGTNPGRLVQSRFFPVLQSEIAGAWFLGAREVMAATSTSSQSSSNRGAEHHGGTVFLAARAAEREFNEHYLPALCGSPHGHYSPSIIPVLG